MGRSSFPKWLAVVAAVLLLASAPPGSSKAKETTSGTVRARELPPHASGAFPGASAAPALGAASGVLIDASDGRVLWEKASRQRRAIASTTKILTALIVIERASTSDRVTASARAESVGSNDPIVTELELVAGETLTVEQLLYGLLLISASDAAVALAEHVGGSVPEFVRMMNSRARELGAVESNFSNADGLDDPRHYSTALDLTKIARVAMENPLFRRIVATRNYVIPGHSQPRMLVNRNQLLGQFPGMNGVKTGNTRAAGPSLIASAERRGEKRISVLLNSPDVFRESGALLDYGFSAFRRLEVLSETRAWGQLTYGDGTSVKVFPRRTLRVLVTASTPNPSSRYDALGRRIVVELPEPVAVPAELRCSGPPCHLPLRGGGSALATFISVFGPILALFR